MPADADLLCDYFLSSQLSNSNKSSSTIVTTKSALTSSHNGNHHHHHHNHQHHHHTTNGSSNFTFESIDFVKYNKNPMSESLKLKYELLAATNNHNNNNTSAKSSDHSTTLVENSISASTALTNGLNHKSPVIVNKTVENGGSKTTTATTTTTTTPALDLTWSRIRKTGIGLLNLGNNCYLNATLQCLAYTPPLSQWLVTRPHSPHCRFRLVKGFCSLCEVERIIFDIFNSAYGCAKPNTLCYNIKKISNLFGVGTQEDASEFFTTLLEHMAKAIKFHSNNNQQQHLNGVKHNNNNNNKRSHTILDDIFAFQFRSRITCSSCGRLSDTIEDTNIWPLEVKYVQDIRKGMLHFLKEEILDGENAYKCEKCGRKTRATKKYSIRSAPNILVVHLKRFDSSHAGKLSHYVAYPETLQLPGLVNTAATNSNNEHLGVQYKLYGVLVHLGYTSHSGHYYSYVRGPPHGQQWYKADDTSVSAVSASDALAQNAYILFYNKIVSPSTATPSSSFNLTNGANINKMGGLSQNTQNLQNGTTTVTQNGTKQNNITTPVVMPPRSILLNGLNGFKNPSQQQQTQHHNHHNYNIPSSSSNPPSSSTNSNGFLNGSHKILTTNNGGDCLSSSTVKHIPTSSTSSYLNSILVAKRPNVSSTPLIAPRIIKSDDAGPSASKIARLEYGPQLPPNIEKSTTIVSNTNGTTTPKKETTTTTTAINGNGNHHHHNNHHDHNHDHHHNHNHHQNLHQESSSPAKKEVEKKETKSSSSSSSSSKKKLRRKRLKKLLRQLRNGRVKPDELTEKQMKLAKTKKEKKRLKKVLKKKSSSSSSS